MGRLRRPKCRALVRRPRETYKGLQLLKLMASAPHKNQHRPANVDWILHRDQYLAPTH